MNVIEKHPALPSGQVAITSPYTDKLRAGKPVPADSVQAMDATARSRFPGARLSGKRSSDSGIVRFYTTSAA